MTLLKTFIYVSIVFFLLGCGTTDNSLRDAGKDDSYIIGFHDGRHSGMKEEGNNKLLLL